MLLAAKGINNHETMKARNEKFESTIESGG